MGKKRRTHVRSPLPTAAARPSGRPGPAERFPALDAPSERPRRWLRWALALFLPLLLLTGVEGLLRATGYGGPLSFFVPTKDGHALTVNRRFGQRFMPRGRAPQPYPVRLAAAKPPGTRRVFVLGESAALGTPAPAFGFARILEAMLGEQFPGQRCEVINAAMRGINSHVIRPIAEECAQHAPDLFLLYMGNNEAIGLHAPRPGEFSLAPYPRLIRARQALNATKVGQFLGGLLFPRGEAARREQNMEYFRASRMLPDDPARQPVYRNFQRNLEAILQTATQSGAGVVVATVAVNLADFPPLGSLHRAGLSVTERSQWQQTYALGTNAEARGMPREAITYYQTALALDDHFAEVHFRLARCSAAIGQQELAVRHFALARDWDALAFRTDRRLNGITRNVVQRFAGAGVTLVEVEQAFAAAATTSLGVPGRQWFTDHVHLTFEGDYLLACTLLPAVARALGLPDAPSPDAFPRPVLTRAECAERLAFTEWDDLSVTSAMVRSQAEAPFLDQLDHATRHAQANAAIQERMQRFHQNHGFARAVAVYQTVLARRPDDWLIQFNHGTLLNDFRDHAGAAAAYARAVKLMPNFLSLRLMWVKALWEAGQREQARQHLQATLEMEPDYPPANEAWRMMAAAK